MPTFNPPVNYFQYPTGSPLLDRMRPQRGITVYSDDGGVTWQQGNFPWLGNLGEYDGNGVFNGRAEGVDYFLGGHSYPITAAQQTTLTNAGYGAYITP